MRLTRSLFALVFCAALPALAQAADAPPKPKFEVVDAALLTDAPVSGDYVLGKKNAPVTLIEYASLSCPHCAHFHHEVVAKLQKDYIESGKLRYILRPFPLNEPALKGAELIDCVGESDGADKYYTFSRVLFEAQEKWAYDANFLTSLKTFAKVGGVDEKKFDACVNDNKRELKILNVKKAAAEELKVDHTPYIFINAHRYDDALTPEKVTAYIDGQLAAKKK